MPLFDLFPLPPGLDSAFITWLTAFAAELAPRDAYEQFLAGRMTQAMARLHLSAQREPLEPNSTWLRYESAADRLYHHSLTALQKYRRANPLELPAEPEPGAPTTPLETAPTNPPARRAHTLPPMSDGAFEALIAGHLATLAHANGNGNGNGHKNGNGHYPDSSGR